MNHRVAICAAACLVLVACSDPQSANSPEASPSLPSTASAPASVQKPDAIKPLKPGEVRLHVNKSPATFVADKAASTSAGRAPSQANPSGPIGSFVGLVVGQQAGGSLVVLDKSGATWFIKLAGIEVVSPGASHGSMAFGVLGSYVRGKEVMVLPASRDGRDELSADVVRIDMPNGRSAAQHLVAGGHARVSSSANGSAAAYLRTLEANAKAERLGLWAGD